MAGVRAAAPGSGSFSELLRAGIDEKFRQAGARCPCLSWPRRANRFSRSSRVPCRLAVEDKLRNSLLGQTRLGLGPSPVRDRFAESMLSERIITIVAEAPSDGMNGPPGPA